MTDVQLIILIKGILAFLLIIGGIYALFIGRKLYLRGVGLAPDKSIIETDVGTFKLKASLRNIGAFVMLTSIAWGYIGYLASPTYKQIKDEIIVTHKAPVLGMTVSALEVGPVEDYRVLFDQEKLLSSFRVAAKDKPQAVVIEYKGRTISSIDTDSLRIVPRRILKEPVMEGIEPPPVGGPESRIAVLANVRTDLGPAEVLFSPSIREKNLVFEPVSLSIIVP